MRRKYPGSFKARELQESEEWESSEWEETDEHDNGSPILPYNALDTEASTPKENEDSILVDTLDEGRKLRKPFSAPASPKLRAMIRGKEEDMKDFMTIPSGANSIQELNDVGAAKAEQTLGVSKDLQDAVKRMLSRETEI
jgi:hypothetical protein